jgi:hypothetical protein
LKSDVDFKVDVAGAPAVDVALVEDCSAASEPTAFFCAAPNMLKPDEDVASAGAFTLLKRDVFGVS